VAQRSNPRTRKTEQPKNGKTQNKNKTKKKRKKEEKAACAKEATNGTGRKKSRELTGNPHGKEKRTKTWKKRMVLTMTGRRRRLEKPRDGTPWARRRKTTKTKKIGSEPLRLRKRIGAEPLGPRKKMGAEPLRPRKKIGAEPL
jgi:hypothetical protein